MMELSNRFRPSNTLTAGVSLPLLLKEKLLLCKWYNFSKPLRSQVRKFRKRTGRKRAHGPLIVGADQGRGSAKESRRSATAKPDA
eukprot:4307178-Amphidinium_carterae.1